jgi:hypothetical protein
MATQISTTQVDIRGLSFILSGFALLISKINKFSYFGILAIAIAIAIKPSNALIVLPILFIPKFRVLISKHFTLKKITFAIFCVTSLNVGWVARNLEFYGFPGGKPDVSNLLVNVTLNPFVIIVRSILFLSSNLGLPRFAAINDLIQSGATWLIDSFGFPSNSSYFSYGLNPRSIVFGVNEDLAANSIFLLFLLITCAGLLWKRKGIPIVKFIIILVLPFIFLNWQPWINRLLLPVFTIVTIYLVMLYSENFASKASKVILSAISIAMFSSSLAYISLSNSRGFPNFHLSGVGSSSQYFNVQPKLATPYLELQRFLSERNFSDISLVGNEDSWEYPVLQQNPKINFSWNDPSTRIVLCLSACGNLRKSNLRVLASFDQNLVLYKRVN